jgi:hypothetical protein
VTAARSSQGVGALHAARDQLGERPGADAQQQHARTAADLLEPAAQLAQGHRAMKGGECPGADCTPGACGRCSPRLTAASSFCSAIGFSRKSIAPMRVASTAVSMVPCPDIITTGMFSWPLAAHSLSRLMPSVSGIQMSSSTRSGRCCVARCARRGGVLGEQDVVPLVAQDLGEQFADADFVVNDENLCHFSSSCFLVFGQPQADADFGATARSRLAEADLAAMLVDDLLDDGQPRPVPRALVVT